MGKEKKKEKKDKAKRSTLTNVKFLVTNAWKIDKSIFWYFGLYTVFTAISPFIGIFAPKFLIDELMGGRRTEALILILGGFFLLSAVVNYLVAYLHGVYYPKMVKARFSFICMMQAKSMNMDFRHTENPKTLNDINSAGRAISNNSDGIEGVYHKLFGLFGSAISFVGYVAIVAVLNPLVLLYLVLNVLITYFLTLRVKTFEHDKKDNISEFDRKSEYIYKTMYDFSYGKDIRIYKLGNWLGRKFQQFKNERVKIHKTIKYKYFTVAAVDVFLLLLREGIIYAYLIYRVLSKGMGIGDFTMYFATISGFAVWMQKVMADIAHITAQNLYLNDFRDFLELDDEKENSSPTPIPSRKPYEIEFRNVSFKYPHSDRYIYRNLSFKIDPGQRLAIVGVNGAGKTTFVKLLARLYDPTEGEILLNGINIKDFNREEYNKLFSVVFQEIKMFAFSVAENVALTSESNINRTKVMEAIEKAGMHEKIKSLKNGIDTSILKVLDDSGVEFSGGENQKLALARALYKNGDIVVLDEPTAALDALAEYNIYKGFDGLVGSKTAIYISHRLASTRFCDVIAFFEDGQIKEYGTHEELLEKKGKYADMFNIQAQYYQEEAEREVV
jgi:ABC-type multidrug transport system fused ATPase/permease subunit